MTTSDCCRVCVRMDFRLDVQGRTRQRDERSRGRKDEFEGGTMANIREGGAYLGFVIFFSVADIRRYRNRLCDARKSKSTQESVGASM